MSLFRENSSFLETGCVFRKCRVCFFKIRVFSKNGVCIFKIRVFLENSCVFRKCGVSFFANGSLFLENSNFLQNRCVSRK